MPTATPQEILERALIQPGLFCVLANERKDFIGALNLVQNSHHCVVFQERQSDVFSDLSDAESEQLNTLCSSRQLGSFFGDRSAFEPALQLRTLLRDCRRLKLPKKSGLCLIVNETSLGQSSAARLGEMLSAWRHFCQLRELHLLLLIHGPCHTLRPLLRLHSRQLSGLASQTAIGDYQYSLLVEHWQLPDALFTRQELFLEFDKQFQAKQLRRLHPPRQQLDAMPGDVDVIYALKGHGEDLHSRMETIAEYSNNAELAEHLNDAVAATVVFSLRSAGEIDALAAMVYQLRCARGEQLKIVVREARRCLRSADESYLLRAGCNLLIPHTMQGHSLRNMISAVQGQVFRRPLPNSMAQLVESRPDAQYQGYAEPNTFSRIARRAFDSSHFSELQHLIVELEPLPDLGLQQALGLCRLRRGGDLLTVANGHILLFFYACNPDDVDIALRNSMDLPVNDIFARRQLHYDAATVDELLIRLETTKPEIDRHYMETLNHRMAAISPQQNAPRTEIHFAKRIRLDSGSGYPA